MFRQLAEAESATHIEQIRKNAEVIQRHYATHSMASKLALLLYAIKEFELNRVYDFLTDNNERAMQVVHAANVYDAHFEKHLIHSAMHFEATLLSQNLKPYVTDVLHQAQVVNADLDQLRIPLIVQARENLERMTAARYQQKLAAASRDEMLTTLLLRTVEDNGYDYFGLNDTKLSAEQRLSDTALNDSDSETVELYNDDFFSADDLETSYQTSDSDAALEEEFPHKIKWGNADESDADREKSLSPAVKLHNSQRFFPSRSPSPGVSPIFSRSKSSTEDSGYSSGEMRPLLRKI